MATPYMTLVLPVPGSTPGPDWATQLVTALGLVDSHDHSTGKGNPVTPAGLNINADLSFGGFQATDLKTATFSAQSSSLSSTFKHCVYDTGGDLYWNNGSGTAVQLTSGSTINVSSVNGISGLAAPASASFSTPDFVFKSASTTYGKIDVADIKLFEYAAGITNAVTIKSPTTLAASYNLTLPAATPVATSYLSMSSAGVLATVSSDTILSGTTSTGANAVGSAMTATGANSIGSAMTATGANVVASVRTRAVTTNGTDPGAGGIVISTSCGDFFITAGSYTDITNLSVTLTVSGRPVMITLMPVGSSVFESGISLGGGLPISAYLRLLRNGATNLSALVYQKSASGVDLLPFAGFSFVDNPGAGTHSYKLQGYVTSSDSAEFRYYKLMAYEI
jgi:hypothetical protein